MMESNSYAPAGTLAARLRDDQFLVVVEVYPPGGADASPMLERFAPLREHIAAVNVADSPMATPLMSGMAAAALFERSGIPAMYNMACRDRNIIALQCDLLGAAALGIQSVFCITGDHPTAGDHPEARPVYEIDSLQLIGLARQLRDEGIFESGRPVDSPPSYLIGGAGSLLKEPLSREAERTAAKVAAGADFIQTPPVFDMKLFREFVNRLRDLGVLEQARLIAGVSLVTTAEQALWTQSDMPGLRIPQSFVDTLVRTPTEQQQAIGLAYATDMLAQVRDVPGVSGVLLYPPDANEDEALSRVLELGGIA